LSDASAALERLVARGEVLLGEPNGDENGADDDATEGEETAP
jgi:chromosome partition protein MukE